MLAADDECDMMYEAVFAVWMVAETTEGGGCACVGATVRQEDHGPAATGRARREAGGK